MGGGDMKEPEQAGHVMFNADAWAFDDLVIIAVVFTVVFAAGMMVYLYRWVRKNMAEDAKKNTGGSQ